MYLKSEDGALKEKHEHSLHVFSWIQYSVFISKCYPIESFQSWLTVEASTVSVERPLRSGH